MDLIKISIIIPIYNAQQYLDHTIESVLNQTFTSFELILVNDGSTDESERICKKWKKQDDRIKYIYQSNSGVLQEQKDCLLRLEFGLCFATLMIYCRIILLNY